MECSDDAVLQAAAAIVAGQISGKAFDSVTDDKVLASAVEAAIRAVNLGIERATAEAMRQPMKISDHVMKNLDKL